MGSTGAATAPAGPLRGWPTGSPCPATVLAAMELRSRLGRLSRRAWPRRIAVLVALLAVVAAVLPASASTRGYSGAITGGGTITIRATFEDSRATKMNITWKDVPTTCIPGASFGFTSRGFPAESYSSTTSGTLSGTVAPEVACSGVPLGKRCRQI